MRERYHRVGGHQLHEDHDTEHDVARVPGRRTLTQDLQPALPIPSPLREVLESETGYSLDNVQLHVGGEAGMQLQEHGKRGVTMGRHIVVPEGGATDEVIRHELQHVIQQAKGEVPRDLDDGARATLEAKADAPRRGDRARRAAKRPLNPPETGVPQFREADYRPPAPKAKPRRAPKPPRAPRPAPRPVYYAPVGDQHWKDPKPARAPKPKRAPKPRRAPRPVYHAPVGDQHWKDPKPARAPKPKRAPRPVYHAPVGDQHWNDANLRGQSVANKIARREARHRKQQALLKRTDNRRAPEPVRPPKLTKRERKDLKAYQRSERLVQQGVAEVRADQKREAAERKQRARAKKKHEHKGFGGFVHDALDVAGNVPVVGGAAGTVDAGLYLAEGDKRNAAVAAAGVVGGALPIPVVGRKLGKTLGKKAAKALSKRRPPKMKSKKPHFGNSVQTEAQQHASLERLARIKRRRAERAREEKFAKRGGKITNDIAANQTTGRGAQDLVDGDDD